MWSLAFRFSHWNFVWPMHKFHVCYMLCQHILLDFTNLIFVVRYRVCQLSHPAVTFPLIGKNILFCTAFKYPHLQSFHVTCFTSTQNRKQNHMSVPINSAHRLLWGRWKNERRSFTKKSSEYFTTAILEDHNVKIQLIVGLWQNCVSIPFLQLLQMEHWTTAQMCCMTWK